MARKKKRKKQKPSAQKQKKKASAQKASPVEQQAPTVTAEAETVAPSVAAAAVAAPAPPTEPPAPPAPPPPAPPPSPPPVRQVDTVADLDADLDDDDTSYESLVALVAGMPDDTPGPGPVATRRGHPADDAPVDEVVEVVVLDDDEGTEAVDRLIAKALVGAPPVEEEVEPEAPLIDLDAEAPATTARGAASSGPGAPGTTEAERLAAVVARGAFDETDVPAISLDLGEVSTPEARARLLAEALAHAEHKEARYRVPMDTGTARRWKGLAATGIFVLAAWVAAAPPGWVRPEPPAQLNAAARARNIRTALLLQAQQVEAFRVRTQRLPNSLTELPVTLPGVRYARSGNRAYQLIGYEPDGNAIVFDSTNPSAGFRVLLAAWPPTEAAP